MEPIQKFVDPVECVKCGQCVYGCVQGAKWTAKEYLDEAHQSGTDFLYDTVVQRVMVENGRASGVVGLGSEGEIKISAERVIICAGGLGSPVILQHSGIEGAGKNLFVDLLVNTYGMIEGLDQTHEPPMTLVNHQYHNEKGFILSPYINSSRLVRFFEVGPRAMTRSPKGLLGIMTKTADDPAGSVFPDGTVSKPVTEEDSARLREGSELAKKILVKMGADSKSIVVSKPQGAHPGGTAAIGRVVDKNLETEVSGLFVCDGSVLPQAPGMPPITTICALGKKLAKILVNE